MGRGTTEKVFTMYVCVCVCVCVYVYIYTVKEIKQYQEKWLQHVQMMDTNRIPKQALQYVCVYIYIYIYICMYV